MKIYGHPWSVYTRKVLMAVAEKGHPANLSLVMMPKGEHKQPAHVARHPFGKVPVLDDDGFVLYEASAINSYLDRRLEGPSLIPTEARDAARMGQWLSVCESYLAPHAHPLIVETLFRRYLGGEPNAAAIVAGRVGMQTALDIADGWLASNAYLAGTSFSLADIHWMPHLEYLTQIGYADEVTGRTHLGAWWQRVSSRPTWLSVARKGPQPYEEVMTADVIEKTYR